MIYNELMMTLKLIDIYYRSFISYCLPMDGKRLCGERLSFKQTASHSFLSHCKSGEIINDLHVPRTMEFGIGIYIEIQYINF